VISRFRHYLPLKKFSLALSSGVIPQTVLLIFQILVLLIVTASLVSLFETTGERPHPLPTCPPLLPFHPPPHHEVFVR